GGVHPAYLGLGPLAGKHIGAHSRPAAQIHDALGPAVGGGIELRDEAGDQIEHSQDARRGIAQVLLRVPLHCYNPPPDAGGSFASSACTSFISRSAFGASCRAFANAARAAGGWFCSTSAAPMS